MVQVELNNYVMPHGKFYTREEVQGMIKLIKTSGQISLNGWMFCKYYHLDEVDWIVSAIHDALNTPNNYQSLLELKEALKGGNISWLRDKYATPRELIYRPGKGYNAIFDRRKAGVFVPLVASEILDICIDLKKGRSIDYVLNSYSFYHDKEVNKEYLERFEDAYVHGELNKCINFICKRSQRMDGFIDYGVSVIRNRNALDYIHRIKG